MFYKLQTKITDEQFELIKEKYGEEVAKLANYGWGVVWDGNYVSIATKTYPGEEGPAILVSETCGDGPVTHEWRDY